MRKQISIHTSVVPLSNSGRGLNSQQLDENCREWLQKGYELFSTHIVGLTPDVLNIAYVWVLYDDSAPQAVVNEPTNVEAGSE